MKPFKESPDNYQAGELMSKSIVREVMQCWWRETYGGRVQSLIMRYHLHERRSKEIADANRMTVDLHKVDSIFRVAGEDLFFSCLSHSHRKSTSFPSRISR